MPDQPAPLDIRTPGLKDALANVGHLCAFEILRRFQRPATVREVAQAAHRDVPTIQRAFDALAAVGLVAAVPAGRNRRLTTWKVTRQAIIVSYLIGNPADEAAYRTLGDLFGKRRRSEISRLAKPRAQHTPLDFHWYSLHAAQFDRAEIRELYDLLQKLEAFYLRCNQRHNTVAKGGSQACNYHVTVDVDPLLEGVLPLPSLQILGRHAGKERPADVTTQAPPPLSAREMQVAQLLVGGATKREAASSCGISEHTVAELTRRTYRKLGISRRAQLAVALDKASRRG